MRRRVQLAASVLGIVFLGAACGGPTAPGSGFSLICPQPLVVESLDGAAVPVDYGAPSPSGASPPIDVRCTPPAGSRFDRGTTAVVCTAADRRRASASCSFAVTVVVPRLVATRFLAFGDSLTYGAYSPARFALGGEPWSYPNQLEGMLRDRYRSQGIVVFNEGIGGERAAGPSLNSPGGYVRLPRELDEHRPEVLLLMEGTNDLNDGLEGAQAAIEALGGMVRDAKTRGIRVFLATVPPAREGGRRGTILPRTVPEYNRMVRELAAREGVVLVDVYAAMDLSLIGIDDLHPTMEGYTVMARSFYEAVRAALEVRVP